MTEVTASDLGIQPSVAVTDRAVARAIGEELRREREERGWSRGHFVSLLPSGIGERTLLSYEHGARQLSLVRLVEICTGLGTTPSVLIATAMQRARLSLANLVLRIDLQDLLNRPSADEKFIPVTKWARNSLDTDKDGSGIVELPPRAVAEMAHMIGISHVELADYLARFIVDASDKRQETGSINA